MTPSQQWMADVGACLGLIRKKQGIKVGAVARHCHVKNASIERWEQGSEMMTLCDVWFFCAACSTAPEDVFVAVARLRELRETAKESHAS